MTSPPPPRPARPRRWPGSLVVALGLAVATPSRAGEVSSAPAAPPRDPDDTAMMRAPYGQPDPKPGRSAPSLVPGYRDSRRLALTLSPAYGSFRLPLLGRPTRRYPGAGALLEADLRLLSFAWLRAEVGYTAHPLDEEKTLDEETGAVVRLANRGTLHTAHAGVGVAVGIDIGPVLSMVDLGVGVFRIGTPTGVLGGQRGQGCLEGGVCDTGLTCSSEGVCVLDLVPEVHAGAAVDVLLRRHWSVGASLRYFALLTKPTEIPIYVIGALRVGFRF